MARARGRLITFEGGEGAGKSTQIKRLADSLRRDGHGVLTTREPGGSPGAEALRGLLVQGSGDRWDPVSEVLLHYAARRDHLTKVILPALSEGRTVLCDRYFDSTFAYQGLGQELGLKIVQAIHDLALGDLGLPTVTPDLTLIFDLPVEQGLARAHRRAQSSSGDTPSNGAEESARETRYEEMDPAFHERLRRGFLQIAAAHPARCRVIDANAGIDAVAQAVAAQVRALFAPPAS